MIPLCPIVFGQLTGIEERKDKKSASIQQKSENWHVMRYKECN